MASAPRRPEVGLRRAARSALAGLRTTASAENTLRPVALRLSQMRERYRSPQVASPSRSSLITGNLAQTYVERIDRLGAIDLDSRARRAFFNEFVDAFTVDPLRLVMDSRFCSCTPVDHSVQMMGRLFRWDRLVATWHRELVLDHALVVHHLLQVERPYRAAGVGPGLLMNGLRLYDQLGMRMIVLQAGLSSGTWHWARCGFDFVPGTADQAIAFYKRMVELLGLPIDTSDFASASDYALAAPDVTIALSNIASILASVAGPATASHLRKLAFDNEIGFYEPIPAAKAIMLSGPGWQGYLPLQGPRRAAFEAYLTSRLSAVRRRLSDLERGSGS